MGHAMQFYLIDSDALLNHINVMDMTCITTFLSARAQLCLQAIMAITWYYH